MKKYEECQDMSRHVKVDPESSWVILSDPESVAGPSRGRSCSWRSRSRGPIRTIRSEPLPAGSACCFLKLCKIWNEHEMNMKWTWNEHDWHDSCSFPKDIESIKMKLWERCQGELEFGSEQTETWIFCWATENKILIEMNKKQPVILECGWELCFANFLRSFGSSPDRSATTLEHTEKASISIQYTRDIKRQNTTERSYETEQVRNVKRREAQES